MARTRRSISIDDKIEKAQADVVRIKGRYDRAVDELQQLMEKKTALQNEALIEAFTGSGKSYDEIMAFLKSNPKRTKEIET
jgi:hypothetical protein